MSNTARKPFLLAWLLAYLMYPLECFSGFYGIAISYLHSQGLRKDIKKSEDTTDS